MARHVLAEVDSTSSEAARLAVAGIRRPTWIFARHQTAARGRRGRPWVSPEGNFAATLLFRPEGDAAGAAQRSFVAALALADALRAVCGPGARLSLKWPNDVLLDGGKVAGILLESAGQAGRLDYLAIGIGVNLAEAPAADQVEPGATPPVSVRGATGLTVTPEDFLGLLAAAFARREAQFCRQGFAPIRADWLALAARLGETITARTGRDSLTGIFEGLAEDGALVLALAGGQRRVIPAADIYF